MMNISTIDTLGSGTLDELSQVYIDAANKAGTHFIKLILGEYQIPLDAVSIGLNGDSSVTQGGVKERIYTLFLLSKEDTSPKRVRIIIGSDDCKIIPNSLEFTLNHDSDCVKDYLNSQDIGKRFNATCNLYQVRPQYIVL